MSSGSDATSEEHVHDNYSSAQYSESQQQVKHRSTSPLSQELSFSGESMPTPRSRPRPPPVQTAEPKLPYPNLAVLADSPFLYSALSPANPHRYSLNDFSMFTLDNVQSQDVSARDVITAPQDVLDRGESTWPAWDDVGTFDFDMNDPMFAQVGIATSEQSVDHITSNPLSRSTSGTTSEAEEMSGARPDFSFDPNVFAAGMPVNWEMPNMIPDLTTDAFDADFGSYIDVSSDAPALLPTENMTMNIAAQPGLGMSTPIDQQQQQQQQSLSQAQLQQSLSMSGQMNVNAYPTSSSTAYLTAAQSFYKDEEVRQWLTQDPTTSQDQTSPLAMGLENCYADAGGMEFVAQDFGLRQGRGGVGGGRSQGQVQQQLEGQFPGEPTWF